MKILRKDSFCPKKWSGGLTTEMFIYPTNSNYKSRDFKFRISTATIEILDSLFTPLPGVIRILTLLEGGLYLEHKNHHKINLKPLEYDKFDGGWHTISKGRAVDLNLMLCEGAEGKVDIHSSKGEQSNVRLKNKNNFNFFYINKGIVNINQEVINVGDLIMYNENDMIDMLLTPHTDLVQISVSF